MQFRPRHEAEMLRNVSSQPGIDVAASWLPTFGGRKELSLRNTCEVFILLW